MKGNFYINVKMHLHKNIRILCFFGIHISHRLVSSNSHTGKRRRGKINEFCSIDFRNMQSQWRQIKRFARFAKNVVAEPLTRFDKWWQWNLSPVGGCTHLFGGRNAIKFYTFFCLKVGQPDGLNVPLQFHCREQAWHRATRDCQNSTLQSLPPR